MTTKIKHIASNIITTTELDTSSLDSHFSGGTGVTYSAGAISIGQAVHSTDSPTFADLTITGNLNITGNIDQYNVTDLDVTDKTITLGSGQIEANSGGSGIIIDGSNASLLWNETNSQFDINNALNVSSASTDVAKFVSAGSYTFVALDNATRDWALSAGSSFGIYDKDASATRMTIDASGNVGIGTSLPQELLHLSATTPVFRLEGGSRSYQQYVSGTNFIIRDVTATANRITLDASGNVGIGTDNPVVLSGQKSLTINGTVARVDLQVSQTTTGSLVSESGYIHLQPASGGKALIGNGGSDLVVDSSGNVGIGTSNPAQKLHVSGGTSASTTVRFGQQFDTSVQIGPVTATASGMLQFLNASGTSVWSMGYRDGGSGTDGTFRIRKGATLDTSGPIISINGSGNFGIGDASPAELLTVKDGNIKLKSNNDGNKGILMLYDAAGTQSGQVYPSAGDLRIWSPNDVLILPSGNVGIGTNSPATKLDVTGTVSATKLVSTDGILELDDNGTHNGIINAPAALFVNIDSDGNSSGELFVIAKDRTSTSGGSELFRVQEDRTAGVTQADGDYLVKMYELNADGFISLYTGEATPAERTKIASYGTSYIAPPGSSRTTASKAALTVGTSAGYAAGILGLKGSSSNDGMLMDNTTGREYRNVCNVQTAAGPSRFWHIKTNIQSINNIMFVARVHGYSYGNGGHIVDIQRSGYAYSSHGSLTGTQSVNNGSSSDTLDIYFASDNYLCFKHTTPNSGYYNGYAFDIKMQSPTGYNFNFQILGNAINAASGNHF